MSQESSSTESLREDVRLVELGILVDDLDQQVLHMLSHVSLSNSIMFRHSVVDCLLALLHDSSIV